MMNGAGSEEKSRENNDCFLNSLYQLYGSLFKKNQ